MEFIIENINESSSSNLEIITPKNINDRGCQLSIIAHGHGKELFKELSKNNIVVDWREPNVIRVAPVLFYNSFQDILAFGQVLKLYGMIIDPQSKISLLAISTIIFGLVVWRISYNVFHLITELKVANLMNQNIGKMEKK